MRTLNNVDDVVVVVAVVVIVVTRRQSCKGISDALMKSFDLSRLTYCNVLQHPLFGWINGVKCCNY